MTGSMPFTYQEILGQTKAWSAAFEMVLSKAEDIRRLGNRDPGVPVVFTGCGSTYYLSLAAAGIYQALTGRPARAVPAGEFVLHPQLALAGDKTTLVAVSRSGTTTETVRAVEQFRSAGLGTVMVITNNPSPLVEMADIALVISEGQERSVAQTRSFSSMYVAAVAVSSLTAGREDLLAALPRLASVGESLLERYEPLAKKIGEDLRYDRIYFLGSGILYGLACEGSLKMKEMALTHCEPFHFLEFRHGPMSMAGETALIVGLLSERGARHERDVLQEMRAKGASVLALGDDGADVTFGSGIPEPARGVLYLPVIQLMAYHRSLAKGLNPDRPNNLEAVVKLDL